MTNCIDAQTTIAMRDARIDDISEIVALVASCGPYLSNHLPYLYLIYTWCFNETCFVALHEGRIIGWCSVLPVKRGLYFLHQLAIAPEARGKGVGFAMFAFLLEKLQARDGNDFRIHFTADLRNKAVHRLNRRVTEWFHLSLEKLPEAVPSLDDGAMEELYELSPLCELDVDHIRRAA